MTIKIWGMGLGAESLLNFIDRRMVKIAGVTDSFATRTGTFCDIQVYMPEQWCGIECDYAVICAAGYEEEILQKIKNYNCHDKILTPQEFYLVLYDDAYKGNDLWQYFRKYGHRSMLKQVTYFNVYDKWFSQFRGTDVVICEIGVFGGGSLQMWKEYFGSRATIIGIDIMETCREFEEDQVKIEIGFQEDPQFWECIKQKYPRIDILLDDGGHSMQQQITTFDCMFQHLSEDGLYLCEDTHTSYWREYGGGYKNPGSYIEYTKKLIDKINAHHIRETDEMQPEYETMFMGGIHYYDSIVLIEKKKRISPPFTITME